MRLTLLLTFLASLVLILATFSLATHEPSPDLEGPLVTSVTVPSTATHDVDAAKVPVPLDVKYRGVASASVLFTDPAIIPLLCGLPGEAIIACVDKIEGENIILPNPCDPQYIGEDFAAVACHEKGHILGWRHEMPSFHPAAESQKEAIKAP